MYLFVDAASDVGNIRKKNEDMILVGEYLLRDAEQQFEIDLSLPGAPLLIAVADGMGGHSAGEIASELVLDKYLVLSRSLEPGLSFDNLSEKFEKITLEVHKALNEFSESDSTKKNMGSTIVALLFYDNKVFYINAGDSRLYRYRKGILRQVSRDHSISEIAGFERENSHVIYNSIGAGKDVFIDFEYISDILMEDDMLLLCSDGLTDMLDDKTIENLLRNDFGSNEIVDRAKKAGGEDNISLILVNYNN